MNSDAILDGQLNCGATPAEALLNQDVKGNTACSGERLKTVLMVAGGGLAHTSGGVGTLIGYLIDCWGSNPDAPVIQVLDTRGQGGIANGIWAFGQAIATLARGCMNNRFSIVHAHMTTRGSVIRKCLLCATANLFGVPTIIHQHGADFHDYFRQQARPIKALVRGTLNRTSAVVVLGEDWREFLIKEVGVNASKIHIVLNGVPVPEQVGPADLAVNDEPTILFLGRLGDRKGVPELLITLGQERIRDRPWRAILAGDGEIQRFQQTVWDSGLSERVKILGWQDRNSTTALLRQADIMVLPSHHEAMPVAVLEALSHGVAVITTSVGAIPEFLEDKRDALLVSPGNIDQLAEAVALLLDDTGSRRRLAAAGNSVFRARLEIGTVAQRLLALYHVADYEAKRAKSTKSGRFRLGRIADQPKN